MQPSTDNLKKLAALQMPYGKYRGIKLIDLPEPYVIWLQENERYPKGLEGLFAELYEIKVNGLEKLVKSISKGN